MNKPVPFLHYNIYLDVPDISSEPVDVRVNQGGSCTLECQAPGKPLPDVKWTKNGKEIKSTENLLLESSPDGNHRLIINNAQSDHAGQYIANVKHKIRAQQMIFNVIVTGIYKENSACICMIMMTFACNVPCCYKRIRIKKRRKIFLKN
jgi:hypothetical protein